MNWLKRFCKLVKLLTLSEDAVANKIGFLMYLFNFLLMLRVYKDQPLKSSTNLTNGLTMHMKLQIVLLLEFFSLSFNFMVIVTP
jgi:hypothetical protein